MKSVLERAIETYNPKTSLDVKYALREILQSLVLVGLSRGGFFQKANFYGGTALRIFYGLDRFSEDLDFTLNSDDDTFNLDDYTSEIILLAESYGIKLDIITKKKVISTPIESAFAKVNTFNTSIVLKIDNKLISYFHKDELIKVKIEVDKYPALGFNKIVKWVDIPEYAPIIVLDMPSLFAGKIHAILCRKYKNSVKGRDYYDFLFFVRNKIKPNIEYLKNKLIQNNVILKNSIFNLNILKDMLIKQFNTVDFEQAKADVKRFVFNNDVINNFNKELFIDLAERISE